MVALLHRELHLTGLPIVTALRTKVVIEHIPPVIATFRAYNIKGITAFHTTFFVSPRHVLTFRTPKSAHFLSIFCVTVATVSLLQRSYIPATLSSFKS